MSERFKGVQVQDAKAAIPEFVAVLNDRAASAADADEARRAIVATVREFPSRARCAMLPWLTLEAALDGQRELVFRA